jgi:acyl transferase domain-containing protein
MEDAPIVKIDNTVAADPRTSHIIAISAKCAVSLTGNIKSMVAYLSGEQDDEFSLARLSYTTTARRQHYPHRAIVSGSDVKEVKARLEEALARGDGMNRQKAAPKVVFSFTGQGFQYLGMGKQLFEAYSTFRADIRRFDQLAQSQGFPAFQRIFTTTDGDIGNLLPLLCSLPPPACRSLWRDYGPLGVSPQLRLWATVLANTLH